MLDNRVETFLALCEIMNYTKTAETLHITQPAVTQQIRWLEEYYGCRLFSYQGKVLRLTEKGETLRRLAQQMTANAQGILQEMEREENTEIHLRIGATKTIGDYMLPPIMVDFLQEHPQYRLHLTVDNTGKLLHMMEEGKIDFAIVEGFFDKEKYDFTLYKRERFLGVCGKNCPLRGKTISLWETHGEPLIDHNGYHEKISAGIYGRTAAKHQTYRHVAEAQKAGDYMAVKFLIKKKAEIFAKGFQLFYR